VGKRSAPFNQAALLWHTLRLSELKLQLIFLRGIPTAEASMNKLNTYSVQILTGWLAFITLELLLLLQAAISYSDHFFSVTQMRQYGFSQGLPFLWHFGMWGDAVVISPLVALVVGRYSYEWKWKTLFYAALTATLVTILYGWIFTLSDYPEAHVQHHRLTTAGIIHLIYMLPTLTVFLIFFLATNRVSKRFAITVSVIIVLHVFVGTHMVLGIINWLYPLDWFPGQPLRSMTGWITILVLALILTWRVLSHESNLPSFIQVERADQQYGNADQAKMIAMLSKSVSSLRINSRIERLAIYGRARRGLRGIKLQISSEEFSVKDDALEDAISHVESIH
jgi:hypothetical protein